MTGGVRVGAVALMVLGLAGCGGPDEVESGAVKRGEASRTVAVRTFSAVATSVGASSLSSSGTGRWALCGMLPSPTGAEYVATVALLGTDVVGSKQADVIATTLTSAGWDVEPTTSEVVTASKGTMTFWAEYGGAINLEVRSGCVDMSGDAVDRLTDRSSDELGLSVSQP